MSHSHQNHSHAHGGAGNLKVAFLLNLGFTIIEIAGGLWTNSIAILTDAVHDSGDCISLGFAWYLHKISSRKRTSAYTYGYRRFSVLSALITGLVLLAGLTFILWKAVNRLMNPEPVLAPGMIALAVIGVLMNGAAVLRVRKGESLSEKVVSWHLLEDTLGWIAVLIGALIMTFRDWPIIDPILSLLISLFVLYNVGRNLRKALAVFLQRSPAGFDADKLENELRELPRVQDVHHMHAWTLDGEHHVLTTHLVMGPGTSRDQILAAKQAVREKLDSEEFEHITVDVELEGEECASKEEWTGKPGGDGK